VYKVQILLHLVLPLLAVEAVSLPMEVKEINLVALAEVALVFLLPLAVPALLDKETTVVLLFILHLTMVVVAVAVLVQLEEMVQQLRAVLAALV
jgi:hypothetical protein